MTKTEHLPPEHQQPDAWHRHTPDEGPPAVEHGAKANAVVLSVAFIGIVGFVALVIGATFLYFVSYTTTKRRERSETTVLAGPVTSTDEARLARLSGPPATIKFWDYRWATEKHLAGYGWGEPATAPEGRAAIPIDQAMDKVIARYSARGADGR